ncbi:MAG: hypothetical protein NVS1B3_04440 [Candidatus Dormibacteraceae bacterium]
MKPVELPVVAVDPVGVIGCNGGFRVSLKVVTQGWPAESRAAAQLLSRKYGDPDESCHSNLTWDWPGPWKRIVAHREPSAHNFPVPHVDLVECFIDFQVPSWKVSDLIRFDGSVVVYRTLGEISARCHDEETNFLAMNLAYDIIGGKRSVDDARKYYAQEFLNYRKKSATPYMTSLTFDPRPAEDPDDRIVSDAELQRAVDEGKGKNKSSAA